MMTTEFIAQNNRYVRKIEDALPGFLPSPDTLQGSVAQAMAYSLTGGGKRIRGVLVLAVSELFGVAVSQAMPFAAALEMIHAYSLIHDDLPCMDDDDMRRGKPSCHILFGEDIALLAGDGLLTLAFETCAAPAARAAFGAEKVLDAIAALAKAAGTDGMIGGQVIDLESEGKTVPLETLRVMDSKKTGALIAVAAEIGCILGGADGAIREKLRSFALDVGQAFQIRDDILDQTGDVALLGKPIGSDEENEKSTYTSHYGLEGAQAEAERLTQRAKTALRETGLAVEFLESLTDFLLTREY
jgi:geranylgeranyl diphosphate synthase type II